ncbi:hypothetical protein SEEM1923_03488 [Salmonella enterica subsp. enterica serovar Miami str. 1923]|nr:hypothetical protein SEEM1923_03488 [Salmonella enterica subsp. enterica serovar Miami str. 1923]
MIRVKFKGLLTAARYNFYISGAPSCKSCPMCGAYPVSLLFSQAGLRQSGVFPVVCNAYGLAGFV